MICCVVGSAALATTAASVGGGDCDEDEECCDVSCDDWSSIATSLTRSAVMASTSLVELSVS